jgi:hypothetical protein
LRTAAGPDFDIPARRERKSTKLIANQPGWRGRFVGHAFLPVIVVPRGAGTINARMAFGRRGLS